MREIDLLTLGDMIAFQPTDSQISLKLLLTERVNPSVLGKLTEYTIMDVLPAYIAPYTDDHLRHWLRQPGFFHWLLTPDTFQVTLQKVKEEAVNTVRDILVDPGSDSRLALVRLKAAEILLKTDGKREKRVSNTLKVTAQLPKHVKQDALPDEIRKLQESIQ